MKRLLLIAVIAASVGCRKAPKTAETQAPVDPRNTNYQPGAGALINSARAGKRAAATNDFANLKVFIFDFELNNNRMPTKEELRGDVKNAGNLLKLIDEGVILFPMRMQKDGLWAYEIDAEKVGGIVLVANAVSRASADDVKKMLGQQ